MDDSQFEQMMEQVDQELKDREIPICSRPLHAVGAVSTRLKIDIFFASDPSLVVSEGYTDLTFSEHIHSWYQDRYGDRLKVNIGPGSAVLLIKSDPWKMVFPRIYGNVVCNCDPDLEKYRNLPRITTGRERCNLNVLNCIEGFPAGLAKALTENEMGEILQFFIDSHETLQSIASISGAQFVNEAIADLQTAVDLLLGNASTVGLSKWSSLQFVEKLLKSFLCVKGEKIPKHHNLNNIAEKAYSAGLILRDRELLSVIQCTAGVRYGEELVTLPEAIEAHHASLSLGRQLIAQIISGGR